MSKVFESEAFLQLQREWAKKLSASGFKDIERPNGSLQVTKCDREDRIRLADPRDVASYRTLCGRWLHVKVWPSRIRKRQWELHAEGIGDRIAVLRCWPMHANHRSTNQIGIRRDAEEMMSYVDTEVMMSESQLAEQRPPESLWAESMQTEGFDPAGYLVPSEGTWARFDGYGRRAR